MDLAKVLQETDNWPADNVSVAVIDGDRITTDGDLEQVYDLMSVTKPLSAYAFLIAMEEGIFDLDDPLGPEGSTVRHLMAHASGVAHDSREPQRKVGERRIYSSAGFEILAEEIERVAGMTFRQYLRLAVLEPLQMWSTALYGSAGHEAYSTAEDMVAFIQEMIHPTLIHESTAKEAYSVQFPELRGIVPGYGMQKPSPWGLGFEIHDHKDPHWMGTSMPEDALGHFGMSGTYMWMVPAWSDSPGAGTGMVCLTDRQFGDWAKPLWQNFNEDVWNTIVD